MQGDKNDFRADPMSEGTVGESTGGGGTRVGTEGQSAHADPVGLNFYSSVLSFD